MAQRRATPARYLVADRDHPLIAIPVDENGRELTYYFVDEGAVDEVLPRSVQDALNLAGAWSDLDWDEMIEALDRIRHESKPTPPIDDLRGGICSTAAPLARICKAGWECCPSSIRGSSAKRSVQAS
jgi:hypothetical protein